MAGPPNEKRPPMVEAMQLVHQVTTIALEMTLPAGLGYWLDQKWGTDPWLVICGAILGFVAAMSHLLQIAKKSETDHDKKNQNQSKP